jgi:hypothetical protein
MASIYSFPISHSLVGPLAAERYAASYDSGIWTPDFDGKEKTFKRHNNYK